MHGCIRYFCSNVKPQAGSVHACLRAHLEFLKPQCRRAEFEEMQLESETFDMKFELRKACAYVTHFFAFAP